MTRPGRPRKPELINRPSDAELAILQVLWERGPSTVREVYSELSRTSSSGYTTVLKILQIMTEKGLVVRDEAQRAHVYSAARAKDQVQKHLIQDLTDRAFQGSAAKLVAQVLSTRHSSAEELAEIRRLLDELEGGSPS